MTPSEQVKILSAVVNGQAHASQLPPEPTLHRLFSEHRVSGRALAYIQANRPSWADPALVSKLTADQIENASIIPKHAAALKALRDEWVPADQPIVIIKGLALFGTTARPETIRSTLDLDILVAHPLSLVQAMKAAGLPEYRKVSPHELINVALADVPIDLHAYYPVWSIDRHSGRSVFDARDGMQVQTHVSKLIVTQIPVDALLEDAVPATIFGVPGVWFPAVTMSVLIACVHCFRDYLSRSSVTARSKPPLKFAEIAEVADYLTLPTFDVEKFSTIAARYCAKDAVEWMIDKVETYCSGIDVLDVASRIRARIGRPAGAYLPPAQAVWTGFWATLQREPTDALIRHATTAETVARLGAIRVPFEGESARVAVLADSTLIGAQHGALHVRAEGCLPIKITASAIGASLSLDIALHRTRIQGQLRLHIDVGNEAFELHWNAGQHYWKKSKGFPDPVLHAQEIDEVLHLRISMQVAWEQVDGAEILAVVIAAGEFVQGFDIYKGTLLPLFLSRPEINSNIQPALEHGNH